VAVKKRRSAADRLRASLLEHGLRLPGAHIKSPWPGHRDLAVNDRTFCYLSIDGEPFSISCKLPVTGEAALALPFTKPTAYGLGRSGWVTASCPSGRLPPVGLFRAWIDESYRAQAPKRWVAQLDGAADAKPVGGALSKRARKTKRPMRPRRA
jgi:hypothetical protein